jgi:FAD/FMN-containing dehydrogenase
MSKVSRRGMIQGLLAGAVVFGFDTERRSWVTEARADTSFSSLPPLDGAISTAPDVLAAASDDFGHIIHRTPVAVLFPGSVGDIVAMVKYARRHGLRISARGHAHTAFGQSQADAGLVIDLTTLDTIHSIAADHAVVDGGVTWRDLLLETTAVDLTPPVLTNFIGLTVGGTLSVGGVSGVSFRNGAQVDNVLELRIVTGEGEVIDCSDTSNPRLFNAALAGLGLCGIIVRAKIRLVPASDSARTFRVFYPDIPSMLDDIRLLVAANADVEDGEPGLHHIFGNVAPTPGGWVPFIEATSFHSAPDDPSADELLAGLHYIPGTLQIEDKSYFDFCDSVYQLVQLLKTVGLLALPHPWLDLFVPSSKMNAFATTTLASFNPADFLPPGLVLCYPFIRDRLRRPMLRVPDEDTFFLFDLLRTTPPDPGVINAVVARNRELYDQNVAQGGSHYTIAAVPLSPKDWKRHFQPEWGRLVSAKSQFDPSNVLGAGVPVFK